MKATNNNSSRSSSAFAGKNRTCPCLFLGLLLLGWVPSSVLSFHPVLPRTTATWTTSSRRRSPVTTLCQANQKVAEAQRLLEQSRVLREDIAKRESERAAASSSSSSSSSDATRKSSRKDNATRQPTVATKVSKWAVPSAPVAKDTQSNNNNNISHADDDYEDYRLYVDIGREEGTWMDPRWGASGRRMEFTLDVRFVRGTLADPPMSQQMVQDNQSGRSSLAYRLQVAPFARLRGGFDDMKCDTEGAYRIDPSSKGPPGRSDALRFVISTSGKHDGDVSVPKGNLYFSIPCFGRSVAQISAKGEMPVTVREMGWHTGWRREESRIVGIFRAVPMEKARPKDGF